MTKKNISIKNKMNFIEDNKNENDSNLMIKKIRLKHYEIILYLYIIRLKRNKQFFQQIYHKIKAKS